MNNCCINEKLDNFESVSPEQLDGLGPGCFVQIPRNGECEWVEVSRIDGDELVGVLHPELSTPLLTTPTRSESVNSQPQTANGEVKLCKEQITALGCDRYCVC